jgi:hypothetical protein
VSTNLDAGVSAYTYSEKLTRKKIIMPYLFAGFFH